MHLLISIVSFLAAIAVLIVVHELGHFAVARACGVKVLRFSIGFGRVLWSRQVGADRTLWTIGALPLGGFVRMLDESDPECQPIDPAELHRSFGRQPLRKRAAIVLAGPLSNFLFAILAFAIVQMAGVPDARPRLALPAAGTPADLAGVREGDLVTAVDGTAVTYWSEVRWQLLARGLDARALRLSLHGIEGGDREATLDLSAVPSRELDEAWYAATGIALGEGAPVVRGLAQGEPAERAGLRPGDLVLSIDGVAVHTAGELTRMVRAAPGRTQAWRIDRAGGGVGIEVTPALWQPPGGGARVGRVGIAFSEIEIVRHGPVDALRSAVSSTIDNSVMTLRVFGRMLVGEASWRNLSGPVRIAELAGQSARAGVTAFLDLLAFVSVSLAVLNLLPVPVLDGGHLLYYLVELVTGKPLPMSVTEPAQRLGVGLLVFLGLLALVSDLTRLQF
jgi:regulator of sigma E protease